MISPEAVTPQSTAAMPTHLLVAVDLSRELVSVLCSAVTMAEGMGAKMTLLHVLEPVSDDPEITLHWGDFPQERRQFARQQLEEKSREAGAELAELVVTEGRAFEEILRNADDRGCDLIFMGRHGEQHGFTHHALGSSVERVVRLARQPVLIVAEETEETKAEPRKILLATDFSHDSRVAIPWAIRIRRLQEARLLLANVQKPLGLPGTPEYRRFGDLIDVMRQEADKRLEIWREEHLPADIQVETFVVEGTPHRALCRLAQREHVSLIVMSTHGTRGWRRAWLGGTAEGLIRASSCSVLVVPPQVAGEESGNAHQEKNSSSA